MRNSKTQAQNRTEAEKKLHIDFVRKNVLSFYISDYETFKKLPETTIFFKALKVQPETKKTICEAFELKIEAMCRWKRELEKLGQLKQSKKRVVCQFTGHYANLLTTNTFLFNSEIFKDER